MGRSGHEEEAAWRRGMWWSISTIWGIVAEVCREIGVAAWLDQQEPGNRQHVSVGTATVALVLNDLGFSNRQLYLVPQFFADKPVEHVVGAWRFIPGSVWVSGPPGQARTAKSRVRKLRNERLLPNP